MLVVVGEQLLKVLLAASQRDEREGERRRWHAELYTWADGVGTLFPRFSYAWTTAVVREKC